VYRTDLPSAAMATVPPFWVVPLLAPNPAPVIVSVSPTSGAIVSLVSTVCDWLETFAIDVKPSLTAFGLALIRMVTVTSLESRLPSVARYLNVSVPVTLVLGV
jgi:hypothetical protein